MNQAQREPSYIVSVSEFAERLRGVFSRVSAFEYIAVQGEASEVRNTEYGLYFTLKDANAVLNCFVKPYVAKRLPKISLGTAITAYGAIRVVDRRSQYQLVVDRIDLSGIGALFAEYQALKERLTREGLFEEKRKRQIAPFPKYVALVSARGKGGEDFETKMRELAPQVRVEFIETRVQGLNADAEVADAIDRAVRLNPDAVVVARGGGSYEDLFTFNREAVVRAIVRSTVPVITSIAHTADHHLADDVADLNFETPTAAAQYIASLWQRGSDRLEKLKLRLDRGINDVLTRALQRAEASADHLSIGLERLLVSRRDRVARLHLRLEALNPAQNQAKRLAKRLEALAVTRARLDAAMPRLVARLRHGAEMLAMRLDSLDPNAPLARGYALVTREGKLVRAASELRAGDAIEARLGHGTVDARVETVRDE